MLTQLPRWLPHLARYYPASGVIDARNRIELSEDPNREPQDC
jgi:hypothetical protein